MNAIFAAVKAIKDEIPVEILRLVFSRGGLRTLDDSILNSVIRHRVLPDCDLVGGREFSIPLSKVNVTYRDTRRFTFHVPKNITGGLSIVSVDSIVSNNNSMVNTGFGNQYRNHNNTVPGAVATMNMQHRVIGDTVSTRLELVGENTITCSDPILHKRGLVLHCNVGNDHKAMSNISAREIPSFCELTVRAAKATIYVRAIILIEEGYIQNGHELGSLTDIIRSDYASATEDYKSYRDNEWKKVTWTGDEVAYGELISLSF